MIDAAHYKFTLLYYYYNGRRVDPGGTAEDRISPPQSHSFYESKDYEGDASVGAGEGVEPEPGSLFPEHDTERAAGGVSKGGAPKAAGADD